jgi:hypothetical protein
VNSYALAENVDAINTIYKIDLVSRSVVDSISLPISGEFLQNRPIQFAVRGNDYLISFVNAGLAGKNSVATGRSAAEYAVVERDQFRLVGHDSLPFVFIYDIKHPDGDFLILEWLDETPGQEGHFRGTYSMDSRDLRLHRQQRREHRSRDDSVLVIGDHLNPVPLLLNHLPRIYWDLVDGSRIVLFKTDSHGDISNQLQIGDRALSSVLVGYNPDNELVYYFQFCYVLASYSPPKTSPDSINNEVHLIRPGDFSIEEIVQMPAPPQVVSNELGSVEFVSGQFVYYFSGSENYRYFLPAMLFIFDTRTNEATWLRVGWR